MPCYSAGSRAVPRPPADASGALLAACSRPLARIGGVAEITSLAVGRCAANATCQQRLRCDTGAEGHIGDRGTCGAASGWCCSGSSAGIKAFNTWHWRQGTLSRKSCLMPQRRDGQPAPKWRRAGGTCWRPSRAWYSWTRRLAHQSRQPRTTPPLHLKDHRSSTTGFWPNP